MLEFIRFYVAVFCSTSLVFLKQHTDDSHSFCSHYSIVNITVELNYDLCVDLKKKRSCNEIKNEVSSNIMFAIPGYVCIAADACIIHESAAMHTYPGMASLLTPVKTRDVCELRSPI